MKVSVSLSPDDDPAVVEKKVRAVVNASISMGAPVVVDRTVGPGRHYSPSDAAKTFGFSATWWRDLCRDGLIKHVVVTEGKKPRYAIPAAAIKTYFDKRTVPATRCAADDFKLGARRRPSRARGA